MMPSPTGAARPAALLAPLIAVMCLAGCAGVPKDAEELKVATDAQRIAADFAVELYRGPTDTIDDYARWADEDLAGGQSLEMIGFSGYPGAVHGEPFGALLLRVTIATREDGPYRACFESEFDYWGVATEEFGDRDPDALARRVECPADAHPVDPPADTRTVHVVPDGAQQSVIDVLSAVDPDASADGIRAEIVSRIPQPTGEREVAYDPSVLVRNEEIGVALGGVDDCVLVARRADGTVEAADVPRVLLQPGELGCRPETALMPADQLRSPH
ncbi:hypothetical protein FVO59_03965 [Microbacterium esteraromaticum]|uniref:Lipoprotein n=1 Tax=Microbacterium esteraromaticum TaxID=57043 RepID=A0A7D7W7R8_9MICO|nr:hypothetical protein [Microbacterium esteraromaticum]QMU96458.1 hypothetical protein FVO59_03965 [Microbacterium esteraromaticum]